MDTRMHGCMAILRSPITPLIGFLWFTHNSNMQNPAINKYITLVDWHMAAEHVKHNYENYFENTEQMF